MKKPNLTPLRTYGALIVEHVIKWIITLILKSFF